MKINNEIKSVADQMQQLDEKQISMVSFLIDGFLLKNKLEAMEGDHGKTTETINNQTARALV